MPVILKCSTNPFANVVEVRYVVRMRPLETLTSWLQRDLPRTARRDTVVIVDQDQIAEIQFCTKFFTYTITADELQGGSFLGCTCFDRVQRVTRYLPEGFFDESAWSDIVDAILENELTCARPLPGRLF